MKIGIIGLGLMGGSLAMALKKYKIAKYIYGYARTPKTIQEIKELNLVDELLSFEELLKKSDVVILAIPVDTILDLMPKLTVVSKDTTIIDLGSTKKIIVDNIPSKIRNNFVAAHPMTGTEKFGPKASVEGLYENKIVVLCDLDKNDDLHKNRAINIFTKIGMKINYMPSDQHDIHACYMSHLPHAISFSLANTVMNHEDPKSIMALAAGGFKDMSRVAKSSPYMWTDIFRQNRINLLESIELFEKQMQKVKLMVQNEEYEELKKWMQKANSLHEVL